MRRLKTLWAALVVGLILTACGTTQTPSLEAPARHTIVGFATLASVDSHEWRAAPTFTRLAQLRHNAARALAKGAISVDAAKHIQARADLARKLLDEAATADRAGFSVAARERLRWAIAAVDSGEYALKGTP
jgi:hypothetical protein